MRYSYNARPPKVELAASKDASRPALTRCYLDAERAELQATDSYILARVPVEVGSGDETGLIAPAAVKASRARDAGGLRRNGSAAVMPAGWDNDCDAEPVVSFPNPPESQWPKVDQLWPALEPVFKVGINATFLKRLAEAIGAEDTEVTLAFQGKRDAEGNTTSEPDNLRPITVTAHRGTTKRDEPTLGIDQSSGLIMPVRVS